jgi:hypothetical protein
MANIYHGSFLRFFTEAARAAIRSPRRQFRQWLGLAQARDPEEARHLKRIRQLVRDGDQQAATQYLLDLADTARRARDANALWWVAGPLGGVEQYGEEARCLYESRRLRYTISKDWNGQPVAGTLVADFRHRTQAWPLRHARFLPLAARRAGRCVAFCEPRLVPLFQRSFPDIEVSCGEGDAQRVIDSADAVVNHQDLFHLFGKDADAIAAAFVPLRADPIAAAELRARYVRDGKPVIGISWGSSNQAKSAPALRDWATLFQNVPATFVSLQYGEIGPALKKLRRWAGDSLIHDETVDQMTSMDRFAAQLTALDAILATSSTVVHLAGALGVPAVVMTEESTLNWPQFSQRTPWYPATVLVRRRSRRWPVVLEDAREKLAVLLEAPPPRRD